jgi:hypothetical protein
MKFIFRPQVKVSVPHFLDAAGPGCCIWLEIGARAVFPPGGGELRTRWPINECYG